MENVKVKKEKKNKVLNSEKTISVELNSLEDEIEFINFLIFLDTIK